MFCPHCGSNIPDGSKFCSVCGNPINAAAPSSPQVPGQQYDQQYDQSYGGPVPPNQGYTAPMDDSSYGVPGGGVPAGAPAQQYPGALRTDRDLVTYILLTLVTCGIYGYWYVYQMAQDANTICYEDGEETPGLLVYILLSIVTCGIYSYYWMYKLANRLQNNGPRYGVPIQEGGSDVLLWLVLGTITCGICAFIGVNIIIKNLNALSDAYNRANGFYA